MTFRPLAPRPAPTQTGQRQRSPDASAQPAGDGQPVHQLEVLDQQLNAGPRGQRIAQLQQTFDTAQVPLQRMDILDEDDLQMRADPAAKSPIQRCGEKEYQRKAAPNAQRKAPTAQRVAEAPAPNQTGMPDVLKSGIESLSGMDMSDVQVHTSSPKPAQINALAYAQGSDIHIGPGQEQHLPHEAWHVVQQRQGRVRPTLETNGVQINDDQGLEREADVMGQRAMSTQLRRRGD